MPAINPDELVRREAESMGRGASLLGHTVSFQEGGEQIVQTVVYDLEPLTTHVRPGKEMHERRVALYVDDHCVASHIIASRWVDVEVHEPACQRCKGPNECAMDI